MPVRWPFGLVFAWLLVGPSYALGQVAADPVLSGVVSVGDTVMTSGTVTLHHLSTDSEGEVDSVSIGLDGTFRVSLPNVPDPARQDVFFASVQHDGVFYFGGPITVASELDSVYRIQAYDTTTAPQEGVAFDLQARNIFFEPDGDRWRVTDLFQIVNGLSHTIVAAEGGATWRYPLVDGATDFTASQSDISPDATTFEDGHVVLRAPLTPGERIVVVRYVVDDLFAPVPTPGTTAALDLLIREPAPLVTVNGLNFVERTELEAGTTYRHFSGADVAVPVVSIVEAEEPYEVPVEWAAIILALLLGAAAVVALRGSPSAVRAAQPQTRADLILAVAQLDEAFDGKTDPSKAETAQYRRTRAELLQRIREAE